MAVFTPINPPPAPKDEYDGGETKAASLVRVEKEIQRAVKGYNTALRLWADGKLNEAYTGFKELSEQAVLLGEQEAGVEGEYDAYCKEIGGISIRRLRALVSANAGELESERASTWHSWRCVGRQNIHGLNDPVVDMDQHTRLTIERTMMRLHKALEFGSSDTVHFLAMGQCAVAAGQHDIGLLAFQRALGANSVDERSRDHGGEGRMGNRWRPLQWWSARAAVQTALLRGDVDVAYEVIASASRQSQQQARVLQQVVGGAEVKVAHSRALCVQNALRIEDGNVRPIAGPCSAVVVRAIDGGVPLAAMGEAITTFYHQTEMEDMATGGRQLLERVAVAINTDRYHTTAVSATSVEAVSIGGKGESEEVELSSAKDTRSNQTVAEANGQDSGDANGLRAGKGGNEERGRHKRQSSSSGDDMPVKRRSTRFIERTGLGSAVGAHGASGSGMGAGIAGGRATASARNGVRQRRGMTLEATDSEAFKRGYDAISAWFEFIGVMSSEEFADTFERSRSVMDTCSRQYIASRGRRSHSYGARESDGSVVSDWCLHTSGVDSSSGGGDKVAAVLRTIKEMEGKYGALTGEHGCKQDQACKGDSEGEETPQEPTISIDECQEDFQANGNIFEILVKYVDRAVEAYTAAPMAFLGSGQLRRATQQAVRIVHEMLIVQAAASLRGGRQTAGWQKAVQSGTLVLALLAEAATGGEARVIGSGHMRGEWVAVIGGAVGGQRPSNSDTTVGRYMVVKAWTDYEIAAARNDAAQAASSLTQCLSWLQGFGGDAGASAAARCAHSGAAVTANVARQRQAQVAQWVQFQEAAQVARSDTEKAVALLEPLKQAPPDGAVCALGFAQQVAATRLLAELQKQLGQTLAASATALHEVRLYVTRLLSSTSDIRMPVRLVVRQCVECLHTVHSEDSGLNVAERTMWRIAAQLAALMLAAAQRFTTDAAVEGPGDTAEAAFVGLGAWLAARLTRDAGRLVCGTNEGADPVPDQDPDQGFDQDSNQGSEHSSDHTISDELAPFDKFVSGVHEALGERGLCTAADGAFLKLVLAAGIGGARHSAATALRCLFDIRLHGSGGERHNSAVVAMGHSAADSAYGLVAAEVEEWLRGHRNGGLRGDLRAIIDRASCALEDIDIGRLPHVALNMDTIDEFLDGAAMPTFVQLAAALGGSAELPLACVAPRNASTVPAACLALPFARAAVQHDALRQRMRAGLPRAVEDYDNILEDYKLHASLHPNVPEPWLSLAQAHADLADELLLGTAAEVIECRYDIASLLRSALVCVALARQLLPHIPVCPALHARVYVLAGSLLFRIAARPLPLLALRVLPTNVLPADGAQDSRHEWDVGHWRSDCARPAALALALARRYSTPPSARRVYSLAHDMLLHASRLDPVDWEVVYMLGKATAKLGASLSACTLYLKVCYLASASSGPTPAAVLDPAALGAAVPEAAADALYKLLSTLTKLLWARQTDAVTVGRFLAALPFASDQDDKLPTTESGSLPSDTLGMDNFVPNTLETGTMESSSANSTHTTLEPADRQAFAAIRAMLELACPPDRRRWHHRIVFLLAWMDYRIFGAAERAKQALLPLLQMRASGKQLASFYKPNSEAPGKHYLYLQKYLSLFIELLVATYDIDGLQLLARKLRRSPESLYDHRAMLRRVAEAEVEMLQLMVHRLDCPRFAIDGTGKEYIVLQHALQGARGAESHAVFRHCRLNRSQFNYARDFARENIVSFSALRQRLRAALATPEVAMSEEPASEVCVLVTVSRPILAPDADRVPASEDRGPATAELCPSAREDLEHVLQAFDRHLDTADKTLALFDLLLEQKKKLADDLELLPRLYDCMADLYVLVLSVYGQSHCAATQPPPHERQLAPLARACRDAADLLASAPHQSRTGAAFWRCVIFDDARHESSQQYKLLDPLLEFHVNKLLDSVREARAQPQLQSAPV
ncbi:Histone transcription regulator 3 [Coemansia sp. RSA 988]|nr:Histone transcription regulator 3 [Coemansia sp. RSA 988]